MSKTLLNGLTRDGEVAGTDRSPLLNVPMRSIGGEVFGKSRKRRLLTLLASDCTMVDQ
jgi:hypothetical protein